MCASRGRNVAFVIGVLVLAGGVANAALMTSFAFQSQPGDFVGQGQSKSFTPADGTFSFTKNFDNGVSMSFQHATQAAVFWFADFAAPNNAPLTVGADENAQRFPFQAVTRPGLSVAGEGRGSNTLTGRFDVFDIQYGPGNTIVSFAADFEQHSEGAAPALFGQVRFNTAVPEPAIGAVAAGAAAMALMLLRGRRSTASLDTTKNPFAR